MERGIHLFEPYSREHIRELVVQQLDARMRQMNASTAYIRMLEDQNRLLKSIMRSSPLRAFLDDNQRIRKR